MTARTCGGHVILDFHCEDEDGVWNEEADLSLAPLLGLRQELASGDLRPLYLAWLAAYGLWERDEDAFADDAEDVPEPERRTVGQLLDAAAEAR